MLLMKVKFHLQMTCGHTRPRDEDAIVERYQSVVANPSNRILSCFLLWQDEGMSTGVSYGRFSSITCCNAFFR